MRELDVSLQQFAEFLLKGQLMRPKAAPFAVRWVRIFLQRPAQDLPLGDQVLQFCDALERDGRWQDWQVRQAEEALRIYFVNFLQRTDWRRAPSTGAVDAEGRTGPLEALQLLRQRIRARHYS